jgi:hypothetical protein
LTAILIQNGCLCELGRVFTSTKYYTIQHGYQLCYKSFFTNQSHPHEQFTNTSKDSKIKIYHVKISARHCINPKYKCSWRRVTWLNSTLLWKLPYQWYQHNWFFKKKNTTRDKGTKRNNHLFKSFPFSIPSKTM